MDITVVLVDITEDPVAPALAVTITAHRWVVAGTIGPRWAVVGIVLPPTAAAVAAFSP